ncbi:MAG TPA: multicopper oxidase domain-containing protein [Terriglobales bacterium]|nr:multicopper oxidase domain-containing protein [Terriglobales bacterium]
MDLFSAVGISLFGYDHSVPEWDIPLFTVYRQKHCLLLKYLITVFLAASCTTQLWPQQVPASQKSITAKEPGAHNVACPRPLAGAQLSFPEDLRSQNGILRVNLTFKSSREMNGNMRYCYIADDGTESPTLRVKPGDLLILKLKNALSLTAASKPVSLHSSSGAKTCTASGMSSFSTNIHFHGLFTPPVCHQDDVLNTMIEPSRHAFEYRIRIPKNQPPGLYWYHPHVHGLTEAQVLGGASGALVVEGIERANQAIAGLPERVLVIRDLLPPKSVETSVSPLDKIYISEKPTKDLSFNFIPILYPDYVGPVFSVKPSEKQFWRVLNASADTQIDLQLRFNLKAQPLGLVAWDGIPISSGGRGEDSVHWQNHIPIPPGGRAEFIMAGPPLGTRATLMTLGVETSPFIDDEDNPSQAGVPQDQDDNTPPRPLATIVASTNAPEFHPKLISSLPANYLIEGSLAKAKPIRQRKLYFSEEVRDPKNPSSSTTFYITEEGHAPAAFDPTLGIPNITVRQGDVENWVIENRSQELHTFHIHQTHFLVMERDGVPVHEPYLRDTVNVPFWDGNSQEYPSITLRMDFRSSSIIGTFPYHCHILQHEDAGMMGLVQVKPAIRK